MKSEVIHAIKSLKNGKSPGIDNVPNELLKGGCEALNDIITKLCQYGPPTSGQIDGQPL